MALCWLEWALLILVILEIIVFSVSGETCKKITTCSCVLSNGAKVDLKDVDGTSDKPSFTKIPEASGSGRTFSWNSCTPFSVTGCDNVLVCQVASPSEPAGSKETSFSVNSDGNVVITYGSMTGTTDYSRSSEITLKCDAKAPGKGTVSDFTESTTSSTSSTYKATFTSSHACPTGGSGGPSSGGLSVGSILLIIFFLLLVTYVILAVLINRLARRRMGSLPELLPHYSFWSDFPFLVKDGVLFTCGCIKSGCSSLYRKCSKDSYAEI